MVRRSPAAPVVHEPPLGQRAEPSAQRARLFFGSSFYFGRSPLYGWVVFAIFRVCAFPRCPFRSRGAVFRSTLDRCSLRCTFSMASVPIRCVERDCSYSCFVNGRVTFVWLNLIFIRIRERRLRRVFSVEIWRLFVRVLCDGTLVIFNFFLNFRQLVDVIG